MRTTGESLRDESPPTSRGRKVRLRRVTFDVFAQLTDFHTMSVLLNI